MPRNGRLVVNAGDEIVGAIGVSRTGDEADGDLGRFAASILTGH